MTAHNVNQANDPPERILMTAVETEKKLRTTLHAIAFRLLKTAKQAQNPKEIKTWQKR